MADILFYKLREATLQGFDKTAQFLIQEPSAIHAQNSTGETVFHWFVIENEIEIISWLRAHGAEIDNKTNCGDTPLLEAASLGYLDMCQYLLSIGADPCIKNDLGYTAIGSAALTNQIRVLRWLTDKTP